MYTHYHFVAIARDKHTQKLIAWHDVSSRSVKTTHHTAFLAASIAVSVEILGIHKLSTISPEWSSLVQKDHYFADIEPIKNHTAFFKRAMKR